MLPENREKRLLLRLKDENINSSYIKENKYFRKYIDKMITLKKAIHNIKELYNKKKRKIEIRNYVNKMYKRIYKESICNEPEYNLYINKGSISLDNFHSRIMQLYNKNCLLYS